ncbi:hypothetical protein Lal_00027008 [Lupinus albus]|nr:hypothetical protein Lal_00027008 [Lupinus albus]
MGEKLLQYIANIKQGVLSVTVYFIELKILWDELDNFKHLPNCYCDIRCTCDALINVIRFLKGLNDDCDSVRSQIILIDSLPNMRKKRPVGRDEVFLGELPIWEEEQRCELKEVLYTLLEEWKHL